MTKTADLLLDVRNRTGEGPVWDAGGRALWWTDIPTSQIHRLNTDTRAHVTFEAPQRVGCFALRPGGGLVVAMEHAFGYLAPETGVFTELACPEAGQTGNRFNDGRCDRRGRFFAGSMYEPRGRETGVLWRLDASGSVTRMAGGVTVANGLAWSPDDRILYWADSPTSRIWRFDYDIETGVIAHQTLWLDGAPSELGRPDGAAVDADGCYWSARYTGGAVIRYTPAGKIDRIIKVPTPRVTMCAFGGPDLRTLFVTTAREGMSAEELAAHPHAGGLFAVDAGVAGLPEPHFAV